MFDLNFSRKKQEIQIQFTLKWRQMNSECPASNCEIIWTKSSTYMEDLCFCFQVCDGAITHISVKS